MRKIFFCCALVILAAQPSKGQQNMLMETLPPEWQKDDFFVETTPDDDFWWKKFEDTLLDSLITIATERTDLQVWGVNAEGFYVGRIPAKFEDGTMRFTVGKTLPACYYLIVAE
jgi:hypothetical protein